MRKQAKKEWYYSTMASDAEVRATRHSVWCTRGVVEKGVAKDDVFSEVEEEEKDLQ